MFSVDEKNNVRMTRGDTGRMKISVTCDGKPYKVAADEQLVLTVAMAINKPPVLQMEIGGADTFQFTSEDTQHCELFRHRYNVKLVRANGDEHTVIPWSYFEICRG